MRCFVIRRRQGAKGGAYNLRLISLRIPMAKLSASVSTLPSLKSVPGGAHDEERNPGTRFDLGPVKDVRVNRSAIERRAASLGTLNTIIHASNACWLPHSVSNNTFTTQSPTDTPLTGSLR